MQSSRRVDLTAWTLCLAAAWFWGWLHRQRIPDDAWTVLRYARNLLDGRGWVFNPGESVNASTSPLNTLAIAGFGALSGDLYTAQLAVFTLGLGGAAACAFMALRRQCGAFAGAAAAAFILCAPLLHTTLGMESPLFLLGLAATWLAWSSGRHVLAAFLLGLAVLARPDAALFAPALLLDRALRRQSFRDLPYGRMLVAGAVPLLPWAAYALHEFGSPLPATLAAKQAQGESGFWDQLLYWRGIKDSLELFDSRGLFGSYKPFALLLVGGIAAVTARRHAVLPLVLFEVARTAAYVAMGVPYYQWYAASAHLTFALVAAALLGQLWAARHAARPLGGAAVVLLGVYLVLTVPPVRVQPENYRVYKAAARWIVENTPEDASVGCLEIGCLGYHVMPRRIVDACGLVSPEGVPRIARGEFSWWFDEHEPDVVVLMDPPRGPFEADVLARPRFRDSYEMFETPGYPEFHIWRRKGLAGPADASKDESR